MEDKARQPGKTGNHTGRGTAGEHVHQILHLAAALTIATRAAAARPADGHPQAAPASDFAGTDQGTGQGLVGAPLGLDLEALADAQLTDWAQDLEALSHVMEALQVQVAAALAGRVRAGRFDAEGVKQPADLFSATLKLSRAESARRLRLAEHFMPTTNALTLVTTPPAQPVAASAFFAGNLSAEQAHTVSRFTEEAQHLVEAGQIEPELAAELERTLTRHARDMDPDSLARIGTRAVNVLDPDGQQPSEGELRVKQGLVFRRPRRGLVGFNGYLTIAQYEMWRTAIESALNPHAHNDINTVNADADPLNPADSLRPDPEPGSTSSPRTDPADVIPGQTEFLDLLRNATTPAPAAPEPATTPAPAAPEPATSGTGSGRAGPGRPFAWSADVAGGTAAWPPTQGPIPDWAQAPLPPTKAEDNGWIPLPDTGTDDGWVTPNQSQDSHGWSLPGIHNPGAGIGAGGAALGTEPWPHMVDGMSVSEPGTDEDIPGLNPIDPASTDAATQDTRSRAQRLLDASIDCIKLAARKGLLPMNGGLKTQLFIGTTKADLQRCTKDGRPGGIAFLPYSGPQPLVLFAPDLCDADVTTMVLGDGHDILNVGRTQRLFTFAQRKILTARDIGCAFPDCTRPAYWTEAHHIIPWQDGGKTNIGNGVIACSYHHHLLHDTDWTVKLVHGIPLFTPPYKIDPAQRPRRNTYHHGLPRDTD
ncbi:HNH endonuclease signature motif containing protein [Arthrobacter livingstonensis]|nr:HNH endonuclease signature motif containing protein [Arthrobacter livingstonensis]